MPRALQAEPHPAPGGRVPNAAWSRLAASGSDPAAATSHSDLRRQPLARPGGEGGRPGRDRRGSRARRDRARRGGRSGRRPRRPRRRAPSRAAARLRCRRRTRRSRRWSPAAGRSGRRRARPRGGGARCRRRIRGRARRPRDFRNRSRSIPARAAAGASALRRRKRRLVAVDHLQELQHRLVVLVLVRDQHLVDESVAELLLVRIVEIDPSSTSRARSRTSAM